MREVKVIMMMLVLLGIALFVEGDQQQQWRKWKSIFNTGATSSVLFPLDGNVYPFGYYFAQVKLGQPPKPYFLDVDTGSDLTWLQCDAPCVRCTKAPHPLYRPTNDLVARKDPLCASLHSGDYECDNPEQCDYEVEYADGGSSLGVLVRDVFSLKFSNGSQLTSRLAFGCGYDQLPGTSTTPCVDGVLGLGKGKAGIVAQLHNQGLVQNVIGHCLGGKGGGFLFFGNDLYDTSQVNWTPMSRDSTKHYSASSAELTFGGKGVGFKNLDVVFDSGSSYSYLSSRTYQALLSLSKYNACLGILNGTEAGLQNLNIIGDISMQDKMMIYDNEKRAIGWSSANCSSPPTSSTLVM